MTTMEGPTDENILTDLMLLIAVELDRLFGGVVMIKADLDLLHAVATAGRDATHALPIEKYNEIDHQ